MSFTKELHRQNISHKLVKKEIVILPIMFAKIDHLELIRESTGCYAGLFEPMAVGS